MVKNNVQHTAETDLHNAVVLNTVDIVANMVKTQQAEISQIPNLIDQIVQAFSASAAVSGIQMPLMTALPTVEANSAPQVALKKRERSGPKYEAMVERMAKARAAKAAKTANGVVQVTETVAVIAPELEAPRRGRGRPRKEAAPKPEPLVHAGTESEQSSYDAVFLRRYPAKSTAEQSLIDTGDGKMTCLVDGKRVSHLKSYLMKTYGLTFADYLRIYDLPSDYPVSPPAFREGKQQFARTVGLGTNEMRQAYKEKLAVAEVGNVTPAIVARASGRARKVTVVDVKAIANVA